MSTVPRTTITLQEAAPRLAAATNALMADAYPGAADLVTREIVRILSGRLSHCTFCRNLRLHAAIDRGFDESMVEQLEDIDHSTLSEPQKWAVRFAQAFLTDPSTFGPDGWSELRRHFDDDEVVDLVLDLVRLRPGSKSMVAGGREPEEDQLVFW